MKPPIEPPWPADPGKGSPFIGRIGSGIGSNSADHSGRRSPEHAHAPDHATLANGLTVSVDAEEWKARAKMAGFLYDRLVSETADL